MAAGGISLVAVVVAFRNVRAPLNPARVYLLTYVMILAVWPGPSSRLWMPIIPLIVAEIGLVVSRLPQLRYKTPWSQRIPRGLRSPEFWHSLIRPESACREQISRAFTVAMAECRRSRWA